MTVPTQEPARTTSPEDDGPRGAPTPTGSGDVRPARLRTLESPLPLLSEVLRRRWYLVVAALLLGAAAGYGIASVRSPVYEATATLLLRDPSTVDTRTFLRADDAVRLTELHAQRAAGAEVYRRVAGAVGLRPDEVADAVAVLPDPPLLGLRVVARSNRAEGASALADATAVAYEDVDAERQAEAAAAAQTSLRERLATISEGIDAAAAALAADPDDGVAGGRLDALVTLQVELEDQLAELGDGLTGGTLQRAVELREPAEVPTSAASPRPGLDAGLAGLAAALAATAGLWLGAMRAPAALSAIGPGTVLDAPLLAVLPGRRRRALCSRTDVSDPEGAIRLVTAAVRHRLGGRPGIVLVVDGDAGPGGSYIVERTAEILRETEADVVLVHRAPPRPLWELQTLRASGALVVVEAPLASSPEFTNEALGSDAVVVVATDRTPTRELHRLRQLLDLPDRPLLGYVYRERAR
jgi:hypothetical protein